MKKPLLFPLFDIENLSLSGLMKCICVILFLFSFEKSYAQLPLQNISCTGCSTTASTGYATASGASTGTGAGATSYSLGTNAVSVQCATVTSDVNGTVGIVNSILATSGTCVTNTSASRKGSLYLASGVNCTGTEIQAIRKGTNSSTFNNEYVGLTPNTNYIFVFKTTIDATCGAGAYTSSSIRFYGGVTPQFTFNCGTASNTGTFIADGASHTGNLTLPITGAIAGSATFNVSGTGFSGMLTTTLTAGQTSVTIPITYDGTGSAGSRTLTITSPTGGGVCSKSVTVIDGTDSDSDGIVDTIDIDDDNDGILDTEEECFGFRGQNTNGAWLGNTTSTASFSFPSSVSQTLVANYNDSQIKYYVNTNGGQPRLSRFGNMTYTASFSPAVPASEIAFYIFDLDGALHTSSNASYTISVNGSSANIPFSSANIGSPAMNYNSGTGVVSSAGVLDNQRIMLKGNSTTLVSSITITGTGISTADDVGYSFFGKKDCDTDNDNIANYLDTDSDADGCSDAFEAGATTSTTANFQFPIASVGTNGLSSTVENNDTPTATTTYTSTYANATNDAIKNCCPSTAPTLSATTKSNVCPATTADISALVSSTCPVGSSLEWHTVSTGFSATNLVVNAATVGAGIYYPVCFSSASTCYSPAPAMGVTVTITTCAGPLTITQPTAITKPVSTLVQGAAPTDLLPSGGTGAIIYSNGSSDPACIAPSGATALSSPLTINSSTGQYSYTTPSTPGTYYFCVKVCDSTSPTADCKVAIYQVTVLPPPCNVGTTAPKIN